MLNELSVVDAVIVRDEPMCHTALVKSWIVSAVAPVPVDVHATLRPL